MAADPALMTVDFSACFVVCFLERCEEGVVEKRAVGAAVADRIGGATAREEDERERGVPAAAEGLTRVAEIVG